MTIQNKENHGYTAYGYNSKFDTTSNSLRFNGELLISSQQAYILGNGYRLYSPGLMRFYTADAFSPFLEGGLNAYAYCSCDPVNLVDPTGRSGRAPIKKAPISRAPTPQAPTAYIHAEIQRIATSKVNTEKETLSWTSTLEAATKRLPQREQEYLIIEAQHALHRQKLDDFDPVHQAILEKSHNKLTKAHQLVMSNKKLITLAKGVFKDGKVRGHKDDQRLKALSQEYGEEYVMDTFNFAVKKLREPVYTRREYPLV
ncbi:RHS repeat-associated core domain-containing protein [Pseudomonas putida]|uniref:RHS repeat-associated core domain-containing protein n=1 Tax=Pseudomonas putida TaxID=303 RepID=UPI0034D474EC